MRNEPEIRHKLKYYEALLAGIDAGRTIDNPGVFLKMSEYFLKETMQMLHTSQEADELVRKFPTEDQVWIRQWFSAHGLFARQVLEPRISILKWVLENGISEGGVTGSDGI